MTIEKRVVVKPPLNRAWEQSFPQFCKVTVPAQSVSQRGSGSLECVIRFRQVHGLEGLRINSDVLRDPHEDIQGTPNEIFKHHDQNMIAPECINVTPDLRAIQAGIDIM